jgi:hypothetical protein
MGWSTPKSFTEWFYDPALVGESRADYGIVDLPPGLTDDDLAWFQEHACGLRIERAWPVVDLRPDPRLIQQILR